MTSTEETKAPKLQKTGYHHGDLRAGLIEATRQLVEERGPDGFSVTDACKLAGVSTAAPYKHFKDKSDMIAAMLLEGMARFQQSMVRALESVPPGTPERITALGREYVNFALTEPGVFQLKFGGYTTRLDNPVLQDAGEKTLDILLREVAANLGTSEITDDIRRRGFMLWSFVHGLSFLLADQKLCDLGGDLILDDLLNDMSARMLAA